MLVGRYTVLLDANVMPPAIVRGALLWFATSRLFRPLWSEAILVEWEESLRRRFPDLATNHLGIPNNPGVSRPKMIHCA